MRKQSWDQRRDVAVRVLARLSLVAALAVLGALFVGGAATSQASSSGVSTQTTTTPDGLLHQVSPTGLLLGAVLIGAGIAVLAVGAFKPPPRTDHRNLVDVGKR